MCFGRINSDLSLDSGRRLLKAQGARGDGARWLAQVICSADSGLFFQWHIAMESMLDGLKKLSRQARR